MITNAQRLNRRFGKKWTWCPEKRLWNCNDGVHRVVPYMEGDVRMMELQEDGIQIARFEQAAINTKQSAKAANLPAILQ